MVRPAVRRATLERHEALLGLLRDGVAGVEPLASGLRVSTATVRRDLARLEGEGRLARTYGGAIVRDGFHERRFDESAQVRREAKAAIARRALDFVPAKGTVFVDAGSTCLALATRLATMEGLTVATRGIEAAVALARSEAVDVVIVGGQVRRLSHGLVGPLSSLALERLAFDVAFLGADAVDPHRGIGEPTAEEAYVKEVAAARAPQVAVLVDSTKLRPTRLPAWTPIPPEWTVVTDDEADPELVAAFADQGIDVVLAG